jgi:hypothetical protein
VELSVVIDNSIHAKVSNWDGRGRRRKGEKGIRRRREGATAHIIVAPQAVALTPVSPLMVPFTQRDSRMGLFRGGFGRGWDRNVRKKEDGIWDAHDCSAAAGGVDSSVSVDGPIHAEGFQDGLTILVQVGVGGAAPSVGAARVAFRLASEAYKEHGEGEKRISGGQGRGDGVGWGEGVQRPAPAPVVIGLAAQASAGKEGRVH